MTPDQIVEAVARALLESDIPGEDWDALEFAEPLQRADYLKQAQAAITAHHKALADQGMVVLREQARIAGLEADLATQIQIGVTDAEEMDQLLERAEAAESALAQAKAREAELVGALRQCLDVLECEEITSAFVIAHIHGAPYSGPTVDVKEMRQLLASTSDEPETGDG